MNIGDYLKPYPRWMYHPTEPARQVVSEEDEKALGEGWSATYIFKAYPKMKFKTGEEPRVVSNPGEEASLGGEWSDTPPPETKESAGQPGSKSLEDLERDAKAKRRA